ncbi:transmembrane protein 179B [Biomphalaria pfeifferi]|uniref:Transmembrane protein 179B n=1 Tax=Biomphalaria pfeifferi TaxID=112525 RepID=A0AAD8F0A0_BIOPF|nr:transmembrane protein 179B [Biomphalaria pfeifferi]
METAWLVGSTDNDEDKDAVFIPMVRFQNGHHQNDRTPREPSRLQSDRNSRGYSPIQDKDVYFPIDEAAWTDDRTSPNRNSAGHDGYDTTDSFPIDETAWTMSNTYSEIREPVVPVEGRDGKVLFALKRHESSRKPARPRTLNLHPLSSISSSRYPDSSLSTQSSQISVESNINFGFQDLDDGSSLVNHRLIKFEHDTAMLFRSLSRPQQKNKKPWHRLLSVWWNSLLALCCSCCRRRGSCRLTCSCRDEKGVHYLQMAKKKILEHLLIVQVVISVIAVILSGAVFFPLGLNFQSFNEQCLLYANIKLIPKTEETGVKVDLTATVFGDVEECNYTTYLNVVTAIASVIFLWFFYHTHSLETSEHSEVKLQLPVFLIHLGLFICVLVSSCKITIGFNYWCDNIGYADVKNNGHCKEYENVSWDITARAFECPFYTFNLLAEASSWLLALTLLLQCLVTSVRLYQDFVTTFQEIEIPHSKLEEVDDTDSLCLERGLTNQASDEFISSVSRFPSVEEYNPETKRKLLAEAIVHQNILAMASGDQLPSKTDPGKPIILDTESFKKKSKSKKLRDELDGEEVESPLPKSQRNKKMIELKCIDPHVTVTIHNSKSSINSESEDYEATEEELSEEEKQQKENDYMKSRSCRDGQW